MKGSDDGEGGKSAAVGPGARNVKCIGSGSVSASQEAQPPRPKRPRTNATGIINAKCIFKSSGESGSDGIVWCDDDNGGGDLCCGEDHGKPGASRATNGMVQKRGSGDHHAMGEWEQLLKQEEDFLQSTMATPPSAGKPTDPPSLAAKPPITSTIECPLCGQSFTLSEIARHADKCEGTKSISSTTTSSSVPLESCPLCSKEFPRSLIEEHANSCLSTSSRSKLAEADKTISSPFTTTQLGTSRSISHEQCPTCRQYFALEELFTHAPTCEVSSIKEDCKECPFCCKGVPQSIFEDHIFCCAEKADHGISPIGKQTGPLSSPAVPVTMEATFLALKEMLPHIDDSTLKETLVSSSGNVEQAAAMLLGITRPLTLFPSDAPTNSASGAVREMS
ncbi:hypothetical protein Pelo_6492 [Pelomyxa schiedti]|nr:hypothetical protein Pelo_6492 [Pelomyxa schiedti]